MRLAFTISAILIASVPAMAAPSELSELSCPDGRFTVANCCRRVDSSGKGFGCTNVAASPKSNKDYKHMCVGEWERCRLLDHTSGLSATGSPFIPGYLLLELPTRGAFASGGVVRAVFEAVSARRQHAPAPCSEHESLSLVVRRAARFARDARPNCTAAARAILRSLMVKLDATKVENREPEHCGRRIRQSR
ncbi:hypothetical protein DFH06DRAFT_1151255 [Mycena polygramma]|nr:hypothetical protein DFH06DRAFT_1151255 [Mycena polygramma]